MIPSANCFKLIESCEACKLTAYLPTPDDVPTIGWGATGKDIHLGLTWTQAQADLRLRSDVMRIATSVSGLLQGYPTTQNQFDALVSFAYNVGVGALQGSTLLADHIAGKYTYAAGEFMKWIYQKKHMLPGLMNRRGKEQSLYMRP